MVNDQSVQALSISLILRALKHVLSSFTYWKLSHLLREANRVANWLASWVRDDIERIVSPQILDDLHPLFEKDSTGYTFERQ